MPIEFAPPQPTLQGFQITPPQSTDPLQTLSQMGQLRTQNLQQQTAGMQLENERMKLDSSKGLMDAMVNGGGDFEKTFKIATQPGSKVLPADLLGLRQHYTQMQQEAANLDKTTRENTSTDIDRYRGLLANVQSPEDLAAANAQADQMGIGKTVPRHTQFSDPAHVTAFSNGLATQSQLLKEATERETQAREKAQAGLAGVQTTEAEQKVAQAERQAAIAEIQGAADPNTGVPSPADWAAIQQRHPKVQLPPGTPTPDTVAAFIRSGVPAEKVPEYRIKEAEAAAIKAYAATSPQQLEAQVDSIMPPSDPMNAPTKSLLRTAISRGDFPAVQKIFKDAYDQMGRVNTAVATARATAPIKIEMAAATAGARADAAGLTDDDYSRAGEQYIRTGIMPAVGRDSITRGRIVKSGNQWARDNGLSPSDVITMQAAYAGDKDSLKKFQAQRDQVVSFEQTAQKNLDLFLNLAAKIPDTGVPWLNKPLRALDQGAVGSENMAAVNAARQVANNEIAKVTSSGGLSGVLSDSARHEVEKYNPDSATFAQTKAVANILKQDMANRHGSMDATLSDIKARIGGTAKPAQEGNAPGAAPSKRHFLNNREIIPKGGVWVYKDTGEKAQ